MSNKKNYPLLPGQTHIEPYYTQEPTEEYEANMRELKQLREITAGSRTTIDDIAEIKTLTSEVNALREMNAKAQEEIVALKENQRWRKCSEELPPTEGSYMCAYKNKNKEDGIWLVDEAVWDGEKWRCKFDFWEDIISWKFKPKAPEDK